LGELLAGKLHDHTAVFCRRNKRIMFFSSPSC